jgi:uncharacterized membrane protein
MTMDSTDRTGSVLGLIWGMILTFIKVDSLWEFLAELGKHALFVAVGTLVGLVVARIWKKFMDKKKDESGNNKL